MGSQPWTNMDILGILSSLPDPHSRHPTFLLSEGKVLLLEPNNTVSLRAAFIWNGRLRLVGGPGPHTGNS